MAFHSNATILESELRAHRRACRLHELVGSWQGYEDDGHLSDTGSCTSLSEVGVNVRDSITDLSDQSLLNDDDSKGETEAQGSKKRSSLQSILKVFSKSDALYSKLDGKLEKEQEHSDDFAIEMSALSKLSTQGNDHPMEETPVLDDHLPVECSADKHHSSGGQCIARHRLNRRLCWAEEVVDNSPEMFEDEYMNDGWGTSTYPRPPKRLTYNQKVELFKDRPDLQPTRDWARKHRQSILGMLCRMSIPICCLLFFVVCVVWILKMVAGKTHHSRG